MTRTANARLAGAAYLLYIAVALPAMLISRRAETGNGIAEQLASIARHAADMRVVVVLSVLSCFCALVLAVTLYSITRDEDRDLARLAFTCRVAEGIIGSVFLVSTLGLLWVANPAGTNSLDAGYARALGAFLLQVEGWSPLIAATFFAVGSMLFCYLLLRGRMIPVLLAWLGVLASVLVVLILPAQLAGFVAGPITELTWYPMLVFEVTLALWLIIKGAALPRTRST